MTAVVHADEVERQSGNGGVDIRTTFDASNGCERLRQLVVEVPAGSSLEARLEGEQEVLYVVDGRGELELGGARHRLEPRTGVYLAPGDAYRVEADERLVLVSVVAPDEEGDRKAAVRKVTVRFEDQPELEASSERSFRYLVNEDAGCRDVTQFVGIVQPSKAPFHSHPYDEVGYIVEGVGIAHVDGEQIPLRAGSCFHLEPEQIHCIENSGEGPMHILGVFHPSGSPADRTYQDNK
jgi:quercetin dioxygenase-like cupin family protein